MRSIRQQILLAAALTAIVGVAWPLAQARTGGAATAQTSAAVQRPATAAGQVTTPKQEWGHNIGDDFFLANYVQLTAYWKKLATESNRIHVEDIGPTSQGRRQLMATVTAPANYANIARYKSISRQLSTGEDPQGRPLTEAQARDLARQGKSVVWIDGGLHASEVLGAQQLMEMVYQMVTRTDDETNRFLNDVIVLFVCANPDGLDLLADGYMKHAGFGSPIQYNIYAGHDNNRDSYMNALNETTNMSRIMYREWFPQIMYNHHQTGPSGAVMFAPPFRDPFSFNFHPGIAAATDLIGAIMQTRFIEEGKPGVVNTKGASYSTWWNGGLRTTAYFHNQIGILTETIGNPTPINIPFNMRFAIPEKSWYWQITPQQWHFRNSIDYSVTANRAVLDFASRYREVNLYRIWQMGRDNVKWGSEDHWTFTPHKSEKICAKFQANLPAAAPAGAGRAGGAGRGGGGGGGGRGGGGGGCNGDAFYTALRAPEYRDPRGFIMASDAPDFSSAVRFVNALIKSGITVHRATQAFTVAGKQYPANSLIVKSAQPFRPHVMDMFEPQDHPDDFAYPGANPTRPYDSAGWTLALQMGVQFDRILDGFDGPFEKLTDFAKFPAGTIRGGPPAPEAAPAASASDARTLYALLTRRADLASAAQGTATGYYFSHKSNNSFIAVNHLLAAGEEVSWLQNGPLGLGTFYVTAKASTRAAIQKEATALGVNFDAATSAPTGTQSKLKKLRIGLVDRYGGNTSAGWTRLALENFDFPFEQVFPPMLDAGNLRAKYDVLLCVEDCFQAGGGGGRGGGGGGGGANAAGGDAAPPVAGGGDQPPAGAGAAGRGAGAGGGGGRGGRGGGPAVKAENDDRPAPVDWEAEYTRRRGSITAATMTKITEFIEQGGTIIAIGGAANGAIQQFKVPLVNHLVKADGTPVAGTDYYVPGSVLEVAVDSKNPLAHGYGEKADVFFDNSPVWKLAPGAQNVRVVAWFANGEPLRSGWAWGQKLLDKGIQMAETNVGQGRLFLFGNDLMFRSQPHGSYKFLFNAMYLSVAPEIKAGQ
jgi:hypothetical protein